MAVTRSVAKNRSATWAKPQTARIVKRLAKVFKSRDARAQEAKFTLKTEFQRSKKKLHNKTKKEERGKVEAVSRAS
jgi:hypothetical protein